MPDARIRLDVIQGATMGRIFEETLGQLRVTQAYIDLLSKPAKDLGASAASVFRAGDYEIRVFRVPQSESDYEPPIWMELFNHGTGLPVDSGRCRTIDDALAIFGEFVAQIECL
jgi:hypothetical protein